MDDEMIVLVNGEGKPIGIAPKLVSHNKNTPLHLAFSCYIFNHKGQFLLTQRAFEKKVFPGVWTNSCCGHPAPDEKIEDAIKRRVKDELGLTIEELEVALSDFRYTAEMNEVVENEICPVFVAKTSQQPQLNPQEVANYKWLNWKAFVSEAEKNPGDYSPWTVRQTTELQQLPLLKKYI